MTNSLETVLIDSINATKEGLGKAVDFALAQAPEVCEQYLRIEFIKATSKMLVLLLIGFLFLLISWRGFKYWWQLRNKIEHPEVMLLALPLLGSALVLWDSYLASMTVLTIYLAPKVYLIEFATKLLKH